MNFDSSVLQVAVEDIIPNRFQPRLVFEDDSLQELSDSIKQHGIIQPLVLRKVGDKYEIIAGERRYKAATMAGLATVPAVISQADDKTSAEAAIVENVQRKDLYAIEEARSYKALLDQGYMSQDQLARKMGLSQGAVSNKLRLLTLPEEIQKAVMDNKISERHARSLLKVKDADEQLSLMKRIIVERLTVRQLDEIIKEAHPNGVQNVNIEEIKENSEDIKTPEIADVIEKPAKDTFNQGVINLGQRQQNRFFNNLESESANMEMTEAINPFEDFTNNNSLFAKTTSVGTQINKADKIEEQDNIEFSNTSEQILGSTIDATELTEAKEPEASTIDESDVKPSDIPKINTSSIVKDEINPINSFSNIFKNVTSSDEAVEAREDENNMQNNPFKAPTNIDRIEPTDLIIEPKAPADDNIEFLDSLDFEPPKKQSNYGEAVNKIESLITNLSKDGIPANLTKKDESNQVVITITINKED